MASAGRLVRLPVASAASLLLLLAVQGWLYELRPALPRFGPLVRDALPLDELPRHDTVPLVAFVLAWAAAGIAIGGLTRWARVDRLKAGVVAATGTATWLLATTWGSIVVVRQIADGQALQAALHVPAVYVAAAIVGLATAVVGRSSSRNDKGAAVLAACVAAGGAVDVASAVTQEFRGDWLVAVPTVVPRLASASVAAIGLALIVLAFGLRRRRRRAWQLTVGLLLVAAFLHVAKGFAYEEAAINTLLAVALVARRDAFDGEADPATRAQLFGRGAVYVAAIFGYGAAALWINRVAADRPYTLGFAFTETAEALLGLHTRGSSHLSGDFGAWFPLSIFILGVAATLSLLRMWLAPWRYRVAQAAQERERARELVARFGVDTLAPFALRADKSYFFSEDELAFLAYRVVADVALVSGDPVGPAESVEQLLPSFLAFAGRRGWRVGVLAAGERYLDLYRKHGLQPLYHGDECVVDVAAFSLDGRPIRKVRQSANRLVRAGYTARVLAAGELAPALAAQLEAVAREWRGPQPQRGFAMEFDSLFAVGGDDAVFVVGFGPEGTPAGFLHFAVSHAGRALSLSSMPRLRTTPNGFNEWLVVESIAWAREHDFDHVSLNFAPFAAILGSGAVLTPRQRLQRRILRRFKGHFQLDNLLAFNRKFLPVWQKRYVVVESFGDVPRVGLAGLAAEGYLPLVEIDR